MRVISCSNSQSFFEISALAQEIEPHSFRGKLLCLQDFLKKLAVLPFALFYKVCKTILRLAGVFLGACFVFFTLGTSEGVREFFVERVCAIAKDVADWILLPFAIITCFGKLLLAFLIHPSFYFKY